MVDNLALVLHHDEQVVLTAVELALSGRHRHKDTCPQHPAPANRRKGGQRPAINTPQALLLRREPKADVGRNDNLRARNTGGRHAS